MKSQHLVLLWAASGLFGHALAAVSIDPELEEWFSRSNGVYSLFEAVNAGDSVVFAQRLKEGEQVNVVNELGDTPLHMAAAAGRADMVRELLKAGADPTVKNRAGRLPVELAANEACAQLCRDGEAAREREIRLFPAVRSNDVAAVKAALDAGMNPNALSANNSHTLLAEAVDAGAQQVVETLLAAGADARYTMPNSKSILHLAAGRGRSELIPLLLKAGADPMARANNAALPIHDAIWSGQTQAALALIPAYQAQGYNPSGGGNGYPVAMAIMRGNTEVVVALLKAGLNPNDRAFASEPLLVQAARRNNVALLKALLEAGADKTARDNSGKTAADYATGEAAALLR